MATKMPLQSRLFLIAEKSVEVLQRYFSENPALGGEIPEDRVIHRGGVEVALSGFDGENCSAEAFVNILRLSRSNLDAFPGEVQEVSNCRSGRAVAIQIGVARCSAEIDQYGNVSAQDLATEGYSVVADGARLDNAACKIGRELENADVIDAFTIHSGEPVGPQGGIVSWVQTLSVYFE